MSFTSVWEFVASFQAALFLGNAFTSLELVSLTIITPRVRIERTTGISPARLTVLCNQPLCHLGLLIGSYPTYFRDFCLTKVIISITKNKQSLGIEPNSRLTRPQSTR
jgi:hypothetical protein